MKLKTLLLLILVSPRAIADDTSFKDSVGTADKIIAGVQESGCPDRSKLKGLCGFITNQVKDSKKEYTYAYEKKLYEAACAKSADSQELKNQKIRVMWTQVENELICNNDKFDVLDGNIIKFGAKMMFEDFLDDVIQWQVNLNKVDETDKRTVLDYLNDQIERHKGMQTELKFKYYYEKLRKAGAKHKSEL